VVDGMRDRDLIGDDGWLTSSRGAHRQSRCEALREPRARRA
jgi:hypothetical protein